MEFSYQKNDNSLLFSSLEEKNLLNVSKTQNYVPLYSKFFNLNSSNANNINLNNKFSLKNIISGENNKFNGQIVTSDKVIKEAKIFFKLSPLIDPIKYIIGKYDLSNNNLLNLPSFSNNDCEAKALDTNNTAYVDSFFTYLTSQLLNNHNFINGLDFYGSFLAIKNDFNINISDDIEYLQESEFFNKNENNLFKFNNNFHSELLNINTRSHKQKITVDNNSTILENKILELSDISDLSELEKIFTNSNNKEATDNITLEFEGKVNSIKSLSQCKTSSTCSSRSSNTEQDSDDEDSEDSENNSDCSEESSASEDEIFITIPKFPVQVIALECCDKTLDSLLDSEDSIDDKELGAIIVQILMILITYQKAFALTHNDLHTNNIMYSKTDKKYLYYKFNNKHYKVPTYGKIFKIIDFGRAIYKFRGNLMCSDSFHQKGDAATQYNMEPYFNDKKPRIEPNYSFDLCRLSCSLIDFITNADEDFNNLDSPIIQIIVDWCKDDKGRNIMYKNNGEERYPDFKLYKMIARTVHNHIPQTVIENKYFEKLFVVGKKDINKKNTIINIDNIPSYQ
jgi:hypothetical protein